MSDPTKAVIIATFSSALGIFAITAALRRMLGITKFSNPSPPPDNSVSWDSSAAFSSETAAICAEEVAATSDSKKIPTEFYRPLDFVGVSFILTIFFGLAVSSVQTGSKEAPTLAVSSLLASMAFQFIMAGIVLASVMTRIGPVEWLGLRWRNWKWVFLITPLTLAAMWVISIILQLSGYTEWLESFGVPTIQDAVELLQKSEDPLTLGLMSVAAIGVAPLCEEIVFRGYLYPAAKRLAGPWIAGICSAMVFAAAHGSLAALLPLFIFGCILVFLYEKTGSIWAPISVHLCFNAATVLVQLAPRLIHAPS